MTRILEEWLQLYLDLFKYDLSWFTTPWVCWWVVPVVLYTVFFLLKWMVLTAPFWLPVVMMRRVR